MVLHNESGSMIMNLFSGTALNCVLNLGKKIIRE